MAKKNKAVQSTDARTQLNKRTDDLMDNAVDMDIDYDENGMLVQTGSTDNERSVARRRLEDYLEEKRLQDELGDEFDNY